MHLAHKIHLVRQDIHLERNHLGIEWVAIVRRTYSK